jgi:hypothetical protein
MTDLPSLYAPERAGVAELIDPRVSVVRAEGRRFVLVAHRGNQRIDARLNNRAFEGSTDARATAECASVSHPHGEASGPGAWSLCTDAKNTRFGGTRSHSSDVLVSAFVFVSGNRGETAYENESVNEDAPGYAATRGGGLC